jgi:hypothetical protein
MPRPNIIMFDDWSWTDGRSDKRARLERWVASVSEPVVIEIGAGTAVPSVRHFANGIARRFGGRINPRDCTVCRKAGESVSRLGRWRHYTPSTTPCETRIDQ